MSVGVGGAVSSRTFLFIVLVLLAAGFLLGVVASVSVGIHPPPPAVCVTP